MILQESILNNWFKKKEIYQIVKYFFDVELTKTQQKIVKKIAYKENNRIVISCMTRYGKSYSVAIGVLLWILRHQNKKVAIVAPTNEKTTIIRNYIAEFIIKSPTFMYLLDLEKSGKDSIRKEVSKKRMTWKNGIEMRTLSAEGTGTALMGFGADLVIVDETCDIKYEVYRAKISRMLGDHPDDSVYIEIGNPWHRDNQMWQHWNSSRFEKIHIGWKDAIKEKRTTKEFIEEQRLELTPAEFKVLYEADFPKESEDQLIKLDWINKAIREDPQEYGDLRLGVDVARFGKDLTVITQGYKFKSLYVITKIDHYSKQDTMETVGRILKILEEKTIKRICIDTDGLGGGVSDRLMELKLENKINANIIQFHGGKSPVGDDYSQEKRTRFTNRKAQAYFYLREQFEKGNIIIPDHLKLKDQLSKMKWQFTSSQKIKILDPGEAKEDTSEKKSPDFADSLMQFVWDLEQRIITI